MTVFAPLDTLPLFIRQGAILPWDQRCCTWRTTIRSVNFGNLRGAGQTESRLILYEDDGETTGYRTGAYARTFFHLAPQADGLTLEIGKAQGQFTKQVLERGYIINFHHQETVHGVLCNGAPLSFLDAVHSLDLAEQGWQWHAADKSAHDQVAANCGGRNGTRALKYERLLVVVNLILKVFAIIPAKAGSRKAHLPMVMPPDSRLRGNDVPLWLSVKTSLTDY